MKSQSKVNYRAGTPEESCAKCAFFESPESCTQVAGVVDAAGLCDLFTPLEGGTTPDTASLESMLFGGGLM